MRRVTVEPHNPRWRREYERECNLLCATLGTVILACHHIGSTAIPTVGAKPIIDILLVVSSLEALDACQQAMIALGYEPKGENGIPGRRYYRKGTEELHTHHVHAYQAGHPDIERHLAFRDYLLAHPDEARAYDRLKHELAERFPCDAASYTAGKDDFIREMDRRASAWRRSTTESMGGI